MRPQGARNITGFHAGTFGWRATITGGDQRPAVSRDIQMATSGAPSRVPPNQAARKSPLAVSTIVEAWHDAKGAVSKMNSER